MSEFCGWDVMDTVLSAPDAHLRIALKALCVDDKVRHKMAMYLWRLSLMDDPEGPAHTGTTTLQQAADGDLQICIQCGKAFYESKNGESSCVHHYRKCIHLSNISNHAIIITISTDASKQIVHKFSAWTATGATAPMV